MPLSIGKKYSKERAFPFCSTVIFLNIFRPLQTVCLSGPPYLLETKTFIFGRMIAMGSCQIWIRRFRKKVEDLPR